MHSDFVVALEEFIRREGLLRRGGSVVVGVSGGVDSILLLQVLHDLAPAWRWQLQVAHFNHQLRGAASNRDETLVRQTARALRLPCVIGREDVRRIARSQGISIEMAARECRHRFLARTARSRGVRTVALAHHADDQVEGFFLRLLRGSGLDGLTGMWPCAISPVDRKVRLIRPLLACSRTAIRAEAERRGLQWHEDATNARLEPLRNRIRHLLLPRLRDEYQPAIVRVVLRTIELLQGEAELLDRAAATWPAGTGTRAWSQLPVALQRRRIQSQLQALGHAVEFGLVERLRLHPGTPWAVSSELCLCLEPDGTLQSRPAGVPVFLQDRLGISFEGKKGEVRFGQRSVQWGLMRCDDPPDWQALCAPGGEVFDADRVGSWVVLRHWQAGDRFQPTGLPRSAKLQDLFVAAKVPRAERRRLLVAETAAGELFWVEGLRIGEGYKVTAATRAILIWQPRPARTVALRSSGLESPAPTGGPRALALRG